MISFIKKNHNYKIFIGILIGGVVFGGIVYATTLLSASEVSYDNRENGMAATNVQDAVEELYEKAANGSGAGVVDVKKGLGVKDVTGYGIYRKGDSVTIGYTMNTGYHYKNITGDEDITELTFEMPGRDLELTINGEANTYYVSYNACSGSGAPSNTTHRYGTASNISSTQPTRSGYDFQGWSTTSCSGSVNYAAGASISNLTTTNNATVPLYAIWKSKTKKCSVACSNGFYATYTNGEMVSCRYSGEYGSAVCNGGDNGSDYALYMCQLSTGFRSTDLYYFCHTNFDHNRVRGGGCPDSYTCP